MKEIESIIEEIDTLPPKVLKEVLDYINYVNSKKSPFQV